MTKKEFLEETRRVSNLAVQRANKYLQQLNLSLIINWNYNDWDYYKDAIGIYERNSVLEGKISIGFNIDNLYKWFITETKENPWSDPYTILDEGIQTNVFHEMGHGIVEFFEDIIEYWDEDEELPFYDKNQMFCDKIFDNEEDSVETFAWDLYDNQVENSGLGKIVNIYLKTCNEQNVIERITKYAMHLILEKVGGMNYANRGDSFYTREDDIVKELSNYDLNGKIIYCNCDNPTMSNFYKFFKSNFSDLRLRGLYATYYDENPKMFYFDGSQEMSQPISSGRFQDNGEIMKKCDIVITNPPFSNSMASELVKMARSLGKHVIMVGPLSMAYQKEMFELIKNNQLNMGYTSINRYNRPNANKRNAPTAWWTTMDVNKPNFKTGIKFNQSNYQTYDDYKDIIDIKDYREIPDDYYGYMGVSPRVLRVLNRNEFDIIGKIRPILNGKNKNEKYVIKRK